MAETTTQTGRCLCGQARWATSGRILWSGHCHCDSCRRATAAPMTSFFGVPRGSVEWTGRLVENLTSGGAVSRRFCPDCGTQMSYEAAIWPKETHLYAGTMDDPAAFVPQAHFHYAERLPWLEVTDDLPKHASTADVTKAAKDPK